ncbi:MAG: hypothetical protein DWH97_08810, partial [Planctomycetota bacterium]
MIMSNSMSHNTSSNACNPTSRNHAHAFSAALSPEQSATHALCNATSFRDESLAWPLVVLGPGGDFTRRYVGAAGVITRDCTLTQHATAERSSEFALRQSFLRRLTRAAYARFEACAIEIFSTNSGREDAQENTREAHDFSEPARRTLQFATPTSDSPTTPTAQSSSHHSNLTYENTTQLRCSKIEA